MKTMQRKIRVLVVDDSAFVRRAVIRMFDGHPHIQVIDVAADGEMAIGLVKRLKPDVVTLDIRMPVLDGLAALERIMRECPTPVVMLSSLTEKGDEHTLRALELGAVDFVDKSSVGGAMDFSGIARELAQKIMISAQVDVGKLPAGEARTDAPRASSAPASRNTEVVLIGSSTGGPPALQRILTQLPADFPCPILVVQHMPEGFTASLAERLNRICAVAVKEAVNGEHLRAGTVYIAPAGRHLKLGRSDSSVVAVLDDAPAGALHRPSVDVLFESAAAVYGGKTCSIVLTGMGKDGAVGVVSLKNAGGRVLVESEETSIVFGMPRAAMEAVEVDGVVPLHAMADRILKMV